MATITEVFSNFTVGDFARVGSVVAVAFGAMLLNRVGLAEDGDYRKCVKKSPNQPPGWTFGIVWGIVYTAYALTWLYASRVLDSEKLRIVDIIFGVGLVINISWAVAIGGAGYGAFPAAAAHDASTVILVILFFYAAFTAYQCVWGYIVPASDGRWLFPAIGFVGFGLYAVWMAVATYLSLTSEKVC
jgi:tryptophan-rich sensory protein